MNEFVFCTLSSSQCLLSFLSLMKNLTENLLPATTAHRSPFFPLSGFLSSPSFLFISFSSSCLPFTILTSLQLPPANPTPPPLHQQRPRPSNHRAFTSPSPSTPTKHNASPVRTQHKHCPSTPQPLRHHLPNLDGKSSSSSSVPCSATHLAATTTPLLCSSFVYGNCSSLPILLWITAAVPDKHPGRADATTTHT